MRRHYHKSIQETRNGFYFRWSAIFFIVYLVLNLYIFMSVFLAVVYNQFKENLKREVRENVGRKDALLDKVPGNWSHQININNRSW